MMGDAEGRTRKRSSGKRRWLRRIALGVGFLIALLLVLRAVVLLRAAKRIRRELEAIRAAREPLNWDELRRADREGRVPAQAESAISIEATELYKKAIEKLAALEGADDARLVAD